MTVTEAMKTIMKEKKVTQCELADMIGTKQNNVAMYLKNNYGTKVENLLRMANACGYDVVLFDREKPSHTYVIGDADGVSLSLSSGKSEKETDIDDRIRRIVAEEIEKHFSAG